MKFKRNIYNLCATLGPIGYLPAPGTCATVVSLSSVYFVKYLQLTLLQEFFLLFVITGASYFIVSQALVFFTSDDPSEIVLDELVGTLWVFIGLPLSPYVVISSIIIFRFFDITKLGISFFEKLPGAVGVLSDDIVAALITNGIMHMIVMWYGF
jgi:phosphatidylglycerophosphatase A